MTKAMIMIATLSLLGSSAFAKLTMPQARYIQAHIKADNIFVAQGFDSNDDVEIFFSGKLPDTCYRRPEGNVTFKGKGKISINLTASKIDDPNVLCIMVEVPYMIPISIGKLQEGNHQISVNKGTPWANSNEINIETPSSLSIDNFTYANVTKIERVFGSNAVMIEGYHPSSCMDFITIEVKPNKNKDTYSVLPIIQQSEDVCDRVIVPFKKLVNLPKLDPRKDALVYVRKIDGRALHYWLKN